MTPLDHFITGFICGAGFLWIALCIYFDVKSKSERFLFLKWSQKARYWTGY